ncbi:head-tail connector protein [Kingella bonacorsii]|uniref:Phage gp6-like head-tail connector protein n=1 Tax=Kingella bonacorsii TaxID=2796361 RepID=A0ABS1BQH8_9NEIS|nr:head-tail connector protein [Kingella bonacorsii]MBK0395535.1 phage gp6-like head-tail connector protein [Kingella bonacorsii]
MPMLTLEEVKAHLRYDSDDNDAALQIMLDAAEQAIKTHCDPNQDLNTAAIKQAALLLIGYWDNNRNAEKDDANDWYLPQPVLALLTPYRTPVAV